MMCPTINEVFDCLRKKHFGSDANFDSVDGRQTKMVAHPIILHEVMNSSSNRITIIMILNRASGRRSRHCIWQGFRFLCRPPLFDARSGRNFLYSFFSTFEFKHV